MNDMKLGRESLFHEFFISVCLVVRLRKCSHRRPGLAFVLINLNENRLTDNETNENLCSSLCRAVRLLLVTLIPDLRPRT